MAFGLLLKPFLEIVDQLLGAHLLQVGGIQPQGIGNAFGVLQPLFKQGAGQFIDFEPSGIGQFGPFEVVGEDLVVQVEVALAFDQDGARSRVKVVQGLDQALGQRLVQGQKGRGRNGNALGFKGIKEVDEHDRSG